MYFNCVDLTRMHFWMSAYPYLIKEISIFQPSLAQILGNSIALLQ